MTVTVTVTMPVIATLAVMIATLTVMIATLTVMIATLTVVVTVARKTCESGPSLLHHAPLAPGDHSLKLTEQTLPILSNCEIIASDIFH